MILIDYGDDDEMGMNDDGHGGQVLRLEGEYVDPLTLTTEGASGQAEGVSFQRMWSLSKARGEYSQGLNLGLSLSVGIYSLLIEF